MSLKIGAKLICVKCQSEFIVTKLGVNTDVICCGESLQNKQALSK
ncbi:hypothetical protein [Peribacillus faecalis]|nr:hypothetical protein [Peribacillus faecalis]